MFEVVAPGMVVEAQSGFENVDLEVSRASWSLYKKLTLMSC